MGPIQRRLVKATLTVVSYPKLTLLISGIFLAIALTLALTRLNISTDQNNLFSPDVPFFHDYLSFIKQFPENEAIYVFVEAKFQWNHARDLKPEPEDLMKILQKIDNGIVEANPAEAGAEQPKNGG